MKKVNLLSIFILSFLIVGCGSDRAGGTESDRNTSVLGVSDTQNDSDKDGLSDEDELNIYFTDPYNPDTDGDGLLDGDEINRYDTNASNPDTDNDGLKDGDEINKYDTNATNPDTDGDCLLDNHEILNYETNATNKDTDGDGVEDGFEIYGDLNISCEARKILNDTPANDNIPIGSKTIDALDPHNDSDGDGQINDYEQRCTEGDPLDSRKICPYILDSNASKAMVEYGYAYVPGGFDVDGDGKFEGGFWMSRFQARKTDGLIASEDVIADVGSINKYVSSNFEVLNKNIQVTNYSEGKLDETTTLAGHKLTFDESIALDAKRITGITPYLALVSLKRTKILDKETGEPVDLNVTLPTMKQYIQVKMLLDADKENNGDGRHIRNGLLGIDPNVPLSTYTLVIDEFTDNTKEYVKNLIQIRDTSVQEGETVFAKTDILDWWRVEKFEMLNRGANATQDLGFGIGSEKDAYGITVRARGVLDITQGVSGALTDAEGTTNGISFRAATPYLW